MQAKGVILRDYVSEKISVRNTSIGRGSVLLEPAYKDELLIDFKDHGVCMTESEAWVHESSGNNYVIQVDDQIHLVSLAEPKGIDFINHSCQSNCGMRGSFQLVARRDISRGEELTLDYSLTEMHPWFTMDCLCKHDKCRGVVTGSDWRKKSIQQEYAGYFSDHIQRRMDLSPFKTFVRDGRESTYLAIKWNFIILRRLWLKLSRHK